MLKQITFLLTLSCIALTCSGCATLLGGIIGYQSGELAAGLAIGAAVDFGGDIARGVGQMTAKENNLYRDFQKKSTFNAQRGEITLPICPFNQKRTMDIAFQLRKKFEENGWTCQQTEKTIRDHLICADHWKETWQCKTAQAEPEQSFELKIDFRSNRDTEIRIKCTDHSTEQTAAVTSQIYKWLEQIVSTPSNST